MQFRVPAASAALIAVVAMSASAAVPVAGAESATTATSSTAATTPHPDAHGYTPLAGTPNTGIPNPSSTPNPTPTPSPTPTPNLTPGVRPGTFTWPLSPRPAVLRSFERPRDQWSAGHRGVDLRTAVGEPVLSAGAGMVAFSGVIAGRGVITIRHSGGLRTTYEPVDQRLAPGIVVHRGAQIGILSPAPGHCVPLTCLHWGVISGKNYLDPLSLLGFGRPILLPLG